MSQSNGPGQSQDSWGSKLGVILAVAGSAVGLGNFLRFPGQAVSNGAGVFMIPYLISLVLLGIPICWAEWTLGRLGGSRGFNSSPGIFYTLWHNPLAKFFGALGMIIPVGVYTYYVYIEAWCLAISVDFMQGLTFDQNAAAAGDYWGNLISLVLLGIPICWAEWTLG
ncbi:MAG: sodium:calcium symporter, partial [Planctomycetota bacterium]